MSSITDWVKSQNPVLIKAIVSALVTVPVAMGIVCYFAFCRGKCTGANRRNTGDQPLIPVGDQDDSLAILPSREWTPRPPQQPVVVTVNEEVQSAAEKEKFENRDWRSFLDQRRFLGEAQSAATNEEVQSAATNEELDVIINKEEEEECTRRRQAQQSASMPSYIPLFPPDETTPIPPVVISNRRQELTERDKREMELANKVVGLFI